MNQLFHIHMAFRRKVAPQELSNLFTVIVARARSYDLRVINGSWKQRTMSFDLEGSRVSVDRLFQSFRKRDLPSVTLTISEKIQIN